jgi:hypothetical protein
MDVEWIWIWVAIGFFAMFIFFCILAWVGETRKVGARQVDWNDQHAFDPSYIKEEGSLHGTYLLSEHEVKGFNKGLLAVACVFLATAVFLAMVGVLY